MKRREFITLLGGTAGELREEELQKVSGGYIGETEKNISRGKTTL